MSSADFNPVFRVYGESEPILKKYLAADAIEKMSSQIKTQAKEATPVIMIYGVYNAGKSTLINALIGQEDAPVADIPTTDRVDPYAWNGFELLDTPGIDAPIEHEFVTHEQLERTDVVVFVLSSQGTSEELKPFELMVDLVKRERRVMIVVNNKTALSPTSVEYVAVKDKICANLQNVASLAGYAGNIVEVVPIEMVNAQSALKAKLKNKPTLLSHSRLPVLESKLTEFLKETSAAHVLSRLAADVKRMMNEAGEAISEKLRNSDAAKQDQVQQRLEHERSLIEAEVLAEIHQAGREMRREVRDVLQETRDQDALEIATDQLIETHGERVQKKMENALTRFAIKLERISEELDLGDYETRQIDADGSLKVINSGEDSSPSKSPIDLKLPDLKDVLSNMKKEHIEFALKTGKEVFPKIFKGIGPKTMEKWAGKGVKLAKWAGPLLDGVMAIKDYYDADKEMQNQIVEKQRYLQQIEDATEQFSVTFVEQAKAVVLDGVAKAFEPAFDQLKQLRAMLADETQQLVNDREFLREQASLLA